MELLDPSCLSPSRPSTSTASGSASTDSGISLAYTAIANHLQEKSGVAIELYRLYDGVAKGAIKIKGKRYDLTGIVQAAFQQLASRIAQEANRLWADDWDLDAIVISVVAWVAVPLVFYLVVDAIR